MEFTLNVVQQIEGALIKQYIFYVYYHMKYQQLFSFNLNFI